MERRRMRGKVKHIEAIIPGGICARIDQVNAKAGSSRGQLAAHFDAEAKQRSSKQSHRLRPASCLRPANQPNPHPVQVQPPAIAGIQPRPAGAEDFAGNTAYTHARSVNRSAGKFQTPVSDTEWNRVFFSFFFFAPTKHDHK